MKRRLLYGAVILVLALNLFFGARIYLNAAQTVARDSAYPSMEMFSLVLEKVRRDYVDGDEATYRSLVSKALDGMVSSLDPHSEFLDPEKFKELQDDTEGTFGGLGIVVAMRDNFITVVAPMEDPPGFKAGILCGDRIVRINGKSAEKLGLQDTVKNLRGDPGTDVEVTVLRPSTGQSKKYNFTREQIKVDMIKDINGRKDFPLGEEHIGYVRVVQFGEKTAEELDTAIRRLKSQGMQALVLDLRWNPGGLLDQAAAVCEKFLPRGKLIVTTEGRNAAQNSERRARGRGDLLVNKDGSPMPVVILVNNFSASAAEIVAGCLQDSKRAILVGEQTFGKGSVQSVIPLQDGYALRLTTAKYYTPSHKVIHEKGITPDIEVLVTDDEERDIQMRRSPGGIDTLEEKDRERVRNSTDPQLDRAMDLLRGIQLLSQRTSGSGKSEKMAAK